MPVPIRRLTVALTLCCALLAGSTAYAAPQHTARNVATVAAADPVPSPSTSTEKRKFAKTRFVADAALAAGATYQWIVKPYKAGKFKKGAHGRRLALVKAAVAGAFAYNRLKAAVRNAQGDPALSKALAPLSAGIASLKALPAKLRKGKSTDGTVNSYDDIINQVKDAGKSAGAEVKNKVPKASQLNGS
ncbi:hypothetical protein ACIQVT_24600 [Streptomyces sp. NPDC100445]|uniref:hypothetical protein n=1 Tax=Streptomyces sp. NPDC100445 TaxID=3366102 RepID=UPI0037FFC866